MAQEDFDTAIKFKEITDKLKMIGSDLTMLDTRKQEAIAGEDFETAKALKVQIDRMKQLVDNLNPNNPFAEHLSEQHQQQVVNSFDDTA